jgi:hypothetical protein
MTGGFRPGVFLFPTALAADCSAVLLPSPLAGQMMKMVNRAFPKRGDSLQLEMFRDDDDDDT